MEVESVKEKGCYWKDGNVDELAKRLVKDSNNDYFVIIGAGHMVNETGIVQGLRDLGYEVELIN